MKRIAYELYDANLSIRENAQKLGCSEAALRKYLKNAGIDRRYDAYYVRWKRIKDFFEANPSATLVQANQELGYSPLLPRSQTDMDFRLCHQKGRRVRI